MDTNIWAAVFSFVLTSCFIIWRDAKNETQKNEKICQNLARALRSEIEVLILFYDHMKLSSTPPQKGKDIKIAYISQDYIAMYESQLDKIGLLDNEDVGAITTFYTLIKALLDSLVYLSHRWELYAQYTRVSLPNSNEIEMKYNDMLNAHKAAFDYQEKIYELYPDVLARLEKYEFQKED